MSTTAAARPGKRSSPRVAVIGDVCKIVDIFDARRRANLDQWQDKIGNARVGGVTQLARILEPLLSQPPIGARTYLHELPDTPISALYPFWEPFSGDSESVTAADVWRLHSVLKYYAPSDDENDYRSPRTRRPEPYDLVIVDDEGAFFRDSEYTWDTFFTTLDETTPILLKTCAPFKGKLGQRLTGFKNVTTIVSIDDLREQGVNLSKGSSWDRTIDELLAFFWKRPPTASPLSTARQIFVVIPYCGVAQFAQRSAGEVYLEHFVYLPAEVEGRFLDRYPGRTFGCGTYVTAAIAYHHLLRKSDNKASAFPPIALALEAARNMHKFGAGPYKQQPTGFVFSPAENAQLLQILLLLSWFNETQAPKDPLALSTTIAGLTERDPSLLFDDRKLIKAFLRSCPLTGRYHLPVATTFRCISARPVSSHSPAPAPSHRHTHLIRDYLHEQIDLETATTHWIVEFGHQTALDGMPYVDFGKYTSVHRTEIEQLNHLRSLIRSYMRNADDMRPFCLAVFGPPGTGKSFAVNELTAEVLGARMRPMRFDVSQFGSDDAAFERAFDLIRDASVDGAIPCVVWDEFDTDGLAWLKRFLGPMQDKEIVVAGRGHPFGKAIFAFSGGTAHVFSKFGDGLKEDDLRKLKVPDFISRLRSYADIQGINQQTDDAEVLEGFDPYKIRRAILLRTYIQRYHKHLIDDSGYASVKNGVIYALVEGVTAYKHGSRSMEQVVASSALEGEHKWRSFHLPSESVLRIHLDPASDIQELCATGEKRKAEVDRVAKTIGIHFDELKFENLIGAARARARFYARVCLAIKENSANKDDAQTIAKGYIQRNHAQLAKFVEMSPQSGKLLEILECPAVFEDLFNY